MHHTLRFYGKHQRKFLRLYLFLAGFTCLPLVGRLARKIANAYGKKGHHGYLLTLAEAERIIDASRTVALGPCNCRQVSRGCDRPLEREILVGTGAELLPEVRENLRPVSKEEAKEVLRQSHQERLLHTMMRCGEHFYAICNCCTCCCVPLRLKASYGVEYALVRDANIVERFQRSQL